MGQTTYTVTWTARASLDLEHHHDWVADHSPTAARRLVLDILTKTERLARWPRRGRPLPEAELPVELNPYREILRKPYRIIYAITDRTVFITAVIHERRSFHLWMLEP